MKSSAQPIDRSAWGRAVMLAMFLHGAAGIALLSYFARLPSGDVHIPPAAMVQSALVVDKNVAPETDLIEPSATTVNDVAVEPGIDYVSRAARSILVAKDQPAGPDALSDLEKKARLVQELSSPQEIARITGGVRSALGVDAMPEGNPIQDIRGFDFNHCIVASAERFEEQDSLEIRETLRDRDGRRVVISYFRRKNAKTGLIEFIQAHTNDKGELEEYSILPDEFADAELRQQPYQIINRFGLVKQIHDQAVLPLLEKFADEADKKALQTTTNPAGE